MTEQEIVNYLKENKTRGVIFLFMPREVREWCESNLLKTDIPFRKLIKIPSFFLGEPGNDPHAWDKLNYDESFCYKCVYCLAEDYEPKHEFKADWEIFDIDEHGQFVASDSDHSPTPYYWWQWQMFLSAHDDKYNNFGGWFYEQPLPNDEKHGLWTANPRVLDTKPTTPTKIRFWRYRE